MEFKFTQTVTLEDFLVFYKYFLIKTFVKPFNIVMISIFMIYLLSGPFFGKPEMLLYALGFVLFLGILYYWLSKNGKKLYEKDEGSFTMDYLIEDASLSFSSKDGKSTKMWSEFHSLQETEGYVFLYLKNKRGLIFVKRVVGTDGINFLIERASKEMLQRNVQRLKK